MQRVAAAELSGSVGAEEDAESGSCRVEWVSCPIQYY